MTKSFLYSMILSISAYHVFMLASGASTAAVSLGLIVQIFYSRLIKLHPNIDLKMIGASCG